jgi:pyruvate dehydrogenase E1 component alpha subunit
MHLIDLRAGFLGATPIVASTIPIAVGAAFGAVLRGEKNVTVIFFGEGATEEGTFHEAANFASLKKLPIVFICENNLYSVYSPMAVRQPAGREVVGLARGHGIPGEQGDGNDVLAVYELAGEAIRQTRAGGGPRFLEFKTYRWREHCGPNYDNDLGYRTPAEFEAWRKLCPIENLRQQALASGALLEAEVLAMTHEIEAEIADAVRFAKDSPFPPENRLLEQVYAA